MGGQAAGTWALDCTASPPATGVAPSSAVGMPKHPHCSSPCVRIAARACTGRAGRPGQPRLARSAAPAQAWAERPRAGCSHASSHASSAPLPSAASHASENISALPATATRPPPASAHSAPGRRARPRLGPWPACPGRGAHSRGCSLYCAAARVSVQARMMPGSRRGHARRSLQAYALQLQ